MPVRLLDACGRLFQEIQERVEWLVWHWTVHLKEDILCKWQNGGTEMLLRILCFVHEYVSFNFKHVRELSNLAFEGKPCFY